MARAQLKIRFRKDRGLWEVDYRDLTGRRHRPLFATEEEAHRHATQVFRTFGVPMSARIDPDITLTDYAERWLEGIVHEKEPHTIRNYTERLRGHVLPALGHLRLREIQRGHIKLFLGEKRRQGYAKNSVRLMKAALSTLLSDAADDGIIPANPAIQLGRRKASRADKLTPAERLQKVRPMSWEQRDAFLAAAAGDPPYPVLFTVLAKAGLRPSEAFGLRPGDLDLRERTLRVERRGASGA